MLRLRGETDAEIAGFTRALRRSTAHIPIRLIWIGRATRQSARAAHRCSC
ncbi:hypothetical protein Q4514_11630 [Celeribacter halophilus]|nr:hypothetical protein [Celeribacter halophilus]MDO6511159.1 hypothetical protein [Celeribacter halophilus]